MTISAVSSFKGNKERGRLYLVPTPIGNLSDMTPRAVETLKNVDLIAAEDTRHTQMLLNHFEISTPQISFHEHNTRERIPLLVKKLEEGQTIAQVSDAGMPSISDPGHELVVACADREIPVVPLPGPNAGLTALIASGLAPQPFYFYGFLPRKNSEQKEELRLLNQQKCSLIVYEAPHRLKKTLNNMEKIFGPERKIVLCRELTKKFEEFLRGTIGDALEWAEGSEIRGEFVLIIQGNENADQDAQDKQEIQLPIPVQVQRLIDQENIKPNAAIKQVAKLNGLDRHEVYNQFHYLDK